jgi:holin-like protein
MLPVRHKVAAATVVRTPLFTRLSPTLTKAGHFLHQLSLVMAQLFGLWALNAAGVWAVAKMSLPIPGNLLGMAALYACLALGIAKLSWFETTGSFLIRHLAFFFVPITVGLMNTGALFADRGIGILFTLAFSAAAGLMLAGWISQRLLSKPKMGGNS